MKLHPPPLRAAPALSLVAAMSMGLSGCAGPQPADYAQQQPVLDLASYFNGPLTAHGMFTDRSGAIVKRFVVQLTGTWQGNEGTLDERFTYSDGSTQRRVWHLSRQAADAAGAAGTAASGLPAARVTRYTGRADDVVGVAVGEAAGPALNWHYTLKLPVDGRTYEVQFDDWMVLVDEHTLLNRAVMSKFGIRLGEVSLSFHKP